MSSPLIRLESIVPHFPDNGGLILRWEGKKEPDFVIKQVRLKLGGDEFWNILAATLGSSIVATFKLAVHPISLGPDMLNPRDFVKGKGDIKSEIVIGTTGKLQAKKKTIIKKMNQIIAQGDPLIDFEFEAGEYFWMNWRPAGHLFILKTKLSIFLRCAETGSCLLNPPTYNPPAVPPLSLPLSLPSQSVDVHTPKIAITPPKEDSPQEPEIEKISHPEPDIKTPSSQIEPTTPHSDEKHQSPHEPNLNESLDSTLESPRVSFFKLNIISADGKKKYSTFSTNASNRSNQKRLSFSGSLRSSKDHASDTTHSTNSTPASTQPTSLASSIAEKEENAVVDLNASVYADNKKPLTLTVEEMHESMAKLAQRFEVRINPELFSDRKDTVKLKAEQEGVEIVVDNQDISPQSDMSQLPDTEEELNKFILTELVVASTEARPQLTEEKKAPKRRKFGVLLSKWKEKYFKKFTTSNDIFNYYQKKLSKEKEKEKPKKLDKKTKGASSDTETNSKEEDTLQVSSPGHHRAKSESLNNSANLGGSLRRNWKERPHAFKTTEDIDNFYSGTPENVKNVKTNELSPFVETSLNSSTNSSDSDKSGRKLVEKSKKQEKVVEEPKKVDPIARARSASVSSSGSSPSLMGRLMSSGTFGEKKAVFNDPSDEPVVWELDSQVSSCPICKQGFQFIMRRKHHCRKCGKVVCDKCSQHFFIIPLHQEGGSQGMARICDRCYPKLRNSQSYELRSG